MVWLGHSPTFWQSLKFQKDEIEGKRRLAQITMSTLVGVVAVCVGAMLGAAEWSPSAVPLFAPARCSASVATTGVMVLAWWIDTYASPPPQHGSDCYMVTRVVGPFCYFTKQALCVQTAHAVLSAVAEVSYATSRPLPQLGEACHALACAVACISIALTVLFIRLNWLEPSWRTEILEPSCARGIKMGQIALISHLASAPIALLDVALIKRQALFAPFYLDALSSSAFVATYALLYCALTVCNFHWSGGHYPYPFMRALKKKRHWLLFWLALVALLDCFILPITFAARHLNPVAW